MLKISATQFFQQSSSIFLLCKRKLNSLLFRIQYGRSSWYVICWRHPGYLRPAVWRLWGSYRRQRIPFHQVATYAALCECDEILSTYNIPYFLYGGALLGAARANNIAGRPGDIDIAVCELNRENFIKLERKFIETGFKLVLNRSHKNKATLYYKYGCDLDFQFFGPISHDIDVHYKLEKYLFPENVSRLESVEIFGRKFHAPNDFEGFLERYYGSEWRTPIKTKDKNNFHKVRDEELRKFLNDDPKT